MEFFALAMANSTPLAYTETNRVEVYNEVDFRIDNKVDVSDSYFTILGPSFIGQNWAKDQNKVTVVWDGTKYDCSIWQYDNGEMEFGNRSFLLSGHDDGLPFLFYGGASTEVYAKDPGEHTFTVSAVEEIIHTIDPKYLPSTRERVTVNLAEYELEPSATVPVPNYSLAILALFSNGGGYCTFTDKSNFWDVVSACEDVRFVVDGSSILDGMTYEASPQGIVKYDGVIRSIDTSFMALYGQWHNVKIMFMNNFNGTTDIVVHVEPLDIP